jgi:O-antigen ligase
MTLSVVQHKIETFLPFWFGLLFFFAQISTSLKSIPLTIVVLFIFFLPDVSRKFVLILKTKWCQAAFFLFFVVCMASFWGPATVAKKLSVIKQYNKLLYLPILAIGLSYARNRQGALIGFLSGMVCTALFGMLLKATGKEYDLVFFNHIMTGFSMAFAACLALFHVFKTRGSAKIIYSLLFALFSFYVLFVNLGRSGYVMYALMLGLLLMMSFPWKQSLVGLCLLGGLLFTAFALSPTIQMRVTTAISNYQEYDKDKITSVGFRMQFHNYAFELFKRHPWFGNGAASFQALFYEENPVPKFGREINEPHSMYWLVASEFGVLGIVALLWFYGSVFLQAWTLQALRIPAVIFISSFMVVNLTDSLLFYSASGYLFVLFAAYCLSETLPGVSKKTSINEGSSAYPSSQVIA